MSASASWKIRHPKWFDYFDLRAVQPNLFAGLLLHHVDRLAVMVAHSISPSTPRSPVSCRRIL